MHDCSMCVMIISEAKAEASSSDGEEKTGIDDG